MKLYIYNIEEIREALIGASGFIGKGDPNLIQFNEERYPWFTLNWDQTFAIVYPSGSLWNRKFHEMLVTDLFPVISPTTADYFLVPFNISLGDQDTPKKQLEQFNDKVLSIVCHHLPYWQYNKQKHVFFVIGDSFATPDVLKDSVIFRSSCHRESPDYALYYDVVLDSSNIQPIERCNNTCCFIGCLETHRVRHSLPFIINTIQGKTIFESTPNFFSELPGDTQERMQNTWIEALNDSVFILAPRGNGLTSIRFFEAMAFGRIPILIADDAKLPLMNKIDYDRFSIRVKERYITHIPRLIEKFHDIKEASAMSRKVWEEYFSPGKLRNFIESSLPVREVSHKKLLM
jgi:hypothetical protein